MSPAKGQLRLSFAHGEKLNQTKKRTQVTEGQALGRGEALYRDQTMNNEFNVHYNMIQFHNYYIWLLFSWAWIL